MALARSEQREGAMCGHSVKKGQPQALESGLRFAMWPPFSAGRKTDVQAHQ